MGKLPAGRPGLRNHPPFLAQEVKNELENGGRDIYRPAPDIRCQIDRKTGRTTMFAVVAPPESALDMIGYVSQLAPGLWRAFLRWPDEFRGYADEPVGGAIDRPVGLPLYTSRPDAANALEAAYRAQKHVIETFGSATNPYQLPCPPKPAEMELATEKLEVRRTLHSLEKRVKAMASHMQLLTKEVERLRELVIPLG